MREHTVFLNVGFEMGVGEYEALHCSEEIQSSKAFRTQRPQQSLPYAEALSYLLLVQKALTY
jgi:hypothetical protein